jgi:hypothetical protein
MSLQDRSQGYEFSELERELIFIRQNVGFVRYLTEDGRLFSLNPSPWFESRKKIHYFAQSCNPPPNNACVEVEVGSEDEVLGRNQDGLYLDVLRYICGWKLFDYQPFLKRKKLIVLDQILHFFAQPYRGTEDNIKRIATCSALYAFSSPPISYDFGGVNAAVLSKKVLWDAFKKPMKIVPVDFFQPTSKIFYCLSEKERTFSSLQSEEINLAFLRPEKMMADIPIVLEDVSIKGNTGIRKQDLEDSQKFITAYLLDSLMLKPEPLKSVEKAVTDAVYVISEDYRRSGIVPYRQNLGDAIPALSAAITRLELAQKTTKKHVDQVLDLWREMHRKARYRMGTSLSISRFYEGLSDNAQTLLKELEDKYGKEYWIPMQEVLLTTSLKNDFDFKHALNELIEKGLALRDQRGVKLL